MPVIKNIATRKKKGYHSEEDMREWREKKKNASKSNNTWYGGGSSNVVKPKNSRGGKAKNGRVKKVTKLTAEFVAAADKKVRISSKPKLL